uniref:Uncharacterized protein n=1 Tax=Timema bartmani TaxID=61472 RepID=A0A7R9F7Z1_9NEOP|nr:unnamed protein product [Timema bartmani]
MCHVSRAGCSADCPVLSLLGQQQQFHAFAFGQRPFLSGHFGNPLDPLQRATDPLGGSLSFRMPAMSNCQRVTGMERRRNERVRSTIGVTGIERRRNERVRSTIGVTGMERRRNERVRSTIGVTGMERRRNEKVTERCVGERGEDWDMVEESWWRRRGGGGGEVVEEERWWRKRGMGQFGLSATNNHWGYGAASPYSSYLGPSALSSCAAAGGGFNTPALGFSAATTTTDLNGQSAASSHDAFGTASTVSSWLSFILSQSEARLLSEPRGLKFDHRLEIVSMHFMYGHVNTNFAVTRRMCEETYPNRRRLIVSTTCDGSWVSQKWFYSSTPDQDSNLDFPVIGRVVYCESRALDRAATEEVPVSTSFKLKVHVERALCETLCSSSVLPDTTGSSGVGELDQHLGGLVAQHATTNNHHHTATNHHHANNGTNNHHQERVGSSGSSASAGLLVPRYPVAADFNPLGGPRSLSDSSAGESPVGSEDILPSGIAPSNPLAGHHLGSGGITTNGTSNSFSSLMSSHHLNHHNQTSASYGGTSSNAAGLYLGTPVLPASLLYSQLYSAASNHQNHHQFHHLHHHHHHHSANTSGQDLQSAMEHIAGNNGVSSNGGGQLQRSAVSDLLGVGSCTSVVSSTNAVATLPNRGTGGGLSDDEPQQQRLGNNVQQQRPHTTTDNNAVWRPY